MILSKNKDLKIYIISFVLINWYLNPKKSYVFILKIEQKKEINTIFPKTKFVDKEGKKLYTESCTEKKEMIKFVKWAIENYFYSLTKYVQ